MPNGRRSLLEGLGLTVERHPVPQAAVQANGMISATNLLVRPAPAGSGDRVVQTEAVDGRRDPKRKTKRAA